MTIQNRTSVAFGILIVVIIIISCSAFHAAALGTTPLTSTSIWGRFQKWQKKITLHSTVTSLDPGMVLNINQAIEKGPVPRIERRYLINGWRWHTASVISDLQRFLDIIRATSVLSDDELKQLNALPRLAACHNFVCNFNWKGLMKIERELFFPWLESLLPIEAQSLFSEVKLQHEKIFNLSAQLGQEIEQAATTFEASTAVDRDRIYALRISLHTMESIVQELQRSAHAIQHIQESIFVPYVASYVNAKDQERFNKKVIRALGPINSQIHLVSMSEALKSLPSHELGMFKKQIPKVAQMLLPLWKKRLYNPKAECLYD